MLEEHELVERIVPLHQEDASRLGSAQILVAVVRIPPNTELCRPLGLWDLGRHVVFLGDKLFRYLRHCIQSKREPLAFVGVGMESYQIVSK